MPDGDDTKEEEQEDVKAEKTDEKLERPNEKSSGGILPWIIFVIVVLCGGAGFVLGRFLRGSRTTETAEYSQEDEPVPETYLEVDEPDGSAADSQKALFYDLEPVIANLNEPKITRYVRAALTLEINSEVDREKARAFLEEKKPLLTNWLAIYLARLSLEDIRGDKNLKRIQSQILDGFNEKLFPDSKPRIKRVLFKEFAVQ